MESMLKPAVVNSLRKIVGPENLFTQPEELLVYSYDATQRSSLPWAVVRPSSAEQIAGIMTLANRELFPVVPRGAGTGMSGGSVPQEGGLVLSLERMKRILEIDARDLVAVVEPGVVTGDLHRAVEAVGLFYPPDPASSRFCTIGGNVAECAGGLRAAKYGVTRDYVLGLEVVLPTGEIVHTGSRTLKSVAGYDLTRLMIGSEGTLGIATRITVKLLPLPETVRTLSAFFSSIDDAARAASAVAARRIVPRALELVDQSALRAVERHLGHDISGGAAAMLIAEVDGPSEASRGEIRDVQAIMLESGAARVAIAGNEEEREQIWKARRSISAALYALKPKKLNEDIVVPRSKIPDMIHASAEIADRHGLLIVTFGHAGDGNIHTNVMFDEPERQRAEAAVAEIFGAALRLGGSISGEHGIGLAKSAYLPLERDAATIGVMKKIKHALDPNNVLNPGKIFGE